MPHLPAHSAPDPATILIADAASGLPGGGRWLLLGCDPAILAEMVPAHAAHIRWVATDVTGGDAARETVRELEIQHVEVWDDPVEPLRETAPFDAVIVAAPPDRDLARRWLLTVRHALVPGGALLLAGANSAGIRSIIADGAALFGPPAWEDYRKKRRIARFPCASAPAGSPAWADEPGVAPGTWRSFTIETRGCTLSLETVPGVFAAGRLDDGTALLLDHLDVPAGARVLDMGCGVGIIGLVATRLGADAADLTDASLLAVATARRNLATHRIAQGRAVASDVYAALSGERYDLIVCNPPFHRGKMVDYGVPERVIAEAPAHLAPAGRLVLVANAFLRYERRMAQVFGRVDTLAETARYRVLSAASR